MSVKQILTNGLNGTIEDLILLGLKSGEVIIMPTMQTIDSLGNVPPDMGSQNLGRLYTKDDKNHISVLHTVEQITHKDGPYAENDPNNTSLKLSTRLSHRKYYRRDRS